MNDGLAGPVQLRVGAALRFRDNHQSIGRLPHASSTDDRKTSRPRFDLIELRSYAKTGASDPRR